MYQNRINKHLIGCLLVSMVLMLAGCEIPSKPNFSIEHSVEVPLLTKQLPFLGGANALVDTSRTGLLHIFDIKDNGVVRFTTVTNYAKVLQIQGLPKLPPGFNYPKGLMVNLGYDDPSNGIDTLDLFDDLEAKISKINDLNYFSKRVGAFSILNASLTLFYKTNLSAGNDVYGGVVGEDPQGNQAYLQSVPGTAYSIDSANVTGLWSHNQPLAKSQIMRFPIQQQAMMGDTLEGAVTFDQSNSNIGDFIANLPTQVRFVGKALINNPNLTDNGTNIYFDTAVGLDIPLEIATPNQPATYADTISVDFSGLPSQQNSSNISQGAIKIYYVNKLPLSAQMSFQMLNEFHQPLSVSIPDTTAGYSKVVLDASQIDPSTLFSSEPARGVTQIQLTQDQINQLNQAKFMVVRASLQTTKDKPVRIQATDYLRLTLSGDFTVKSNVNNKGN